MRHFVIMLPSIIMLIFLVHLIEMLFKYDLVSSPHMISAHRVLARDSCHYSLSNLSYICGYIPIEESDITLVTLALQSVMLNKKQNLSG